MRGSLLRSLAPLLASVLLAGCAHSRLQTSSKLVVISVDSLQPDFYLSETSPAQVLKGLAAHGAVVRRVEAVYPSITYPVHTSLVTGAKPGRHGIYSNRVFDLKKGQTQAWYWNASSIRVPTLWDQVQATGKTAALLGWPATVGAQASWVVPEVFPEQGFDPAQIWQETVKVTDPRLLSELPPGPFRGTLQRDEWMTEAALRVLHSRSPDLTLLHLSHLDVVQHIRGPGSPEAIQALGDVDKLVGRVAQSLDLSRDCLMIVGDHGFAQIKNVLRINSFFRERGWLNDRGWKAFASVNGAQAAIYLKTPDPKLKREVLQALRSRSSGLYQVIEGPTVLSAFPTAIAVVEPEIGIAISPEDRGAFREKVQGPRGEHGYLPSKPEMMTGFIAQGSCARAGVSIDHASVLDIASTLAEAAGVTLPAAEGHALRLK